MSAFELVDIDGSGRIVWSEFLYAMMGKASEHVGPAADLKVLGPALDKIKGLLQDLNE